MKNEESVQNGQLKTGIEGLDEVLSGGFARNRVFLIEGDPGSGKTTLALQFLREGVKCRERCLYVTLSETKEELKAVAASHGWTLDGIDCFELTPEPLQNGEGEDQYTFFHPSEVELNETTKAMLEMVEKIQPTRVVFDSLSEIRLLARDPLRYRRQILGLKQYFIGRQCTVILLDDQTSGIGESQLQSIAHGVLILEQLSPEYGSERRRLRVSKYRGMKYRGGLHDFVIERGGLRVYPRLVANEHHTPFVGTNTLSGVASLDELLAGGIPRGSSTLLIGPAGSGKSSVAAQYAFAAMEREEKVSIYTFDEGLGTMFSRTKGLGIDLSSFVGKGLLTAEQIDPAELSPGEFIWKVKDSVEKKKTKVVIIDSLNGYLNAMPEEKFLLIQLHELLSYLNQQGVVTMLLAAQHGILGNTMTSPIDASYLTDNVLLFRYFEYRGAVKKAISVVKKRGGPHECTIRELILSSKGISVGPPLTGMHGILTGVPSSKGDPHEEGS